ncbi:hypothetical protein AAG570_002162 [Ranatra chinensis]|uniref:Chitin-binding type-2 domain-containing protein n=1 Tax=Ranatra chinensis TaxID=642074 RepID=A0ABD0YV41_9HEMI
MITQNYLAIAKQSNIPLQDRFNFNQYKPQPIVQPLPQAQPLVRVQPLPQEQPLVRVQPTKQQLIQLLQRKQFLLQNAQPVRTLARPPVQPPSEDIVTITQSQEIPVQQPTPLPPGGYELPLYQPPTYEKPEPEKSPSYQSEEVEDRHEENFNTILEGYQLSKALPERITSENLDSSIKTLTKLLKILQKAHALPQSARQLVNSFPKNDGTFAARAKELAKKIPPLRQEGSTPGRPGVDYPAHTDIPETHFNCKDQRYKGFFGDPETGCQVWHYCDLNGGQASFLCPNGTIFSQVALTCDWWFNVKCSSTAQLYVLNERLYKYILPQKPSFPEDFAGPLVDRYLTLKFQEIERNKTEEALKKEMESANEKEEDSSSEKADKEPEEEEEEEEKEMPAAD